MAIGNPQAHGWIALRSGHKEPVINAFEQIQSLHAALGSLEAPDALHLARAVWDRLLTLPRKELGPNEGSDLCALVFTSSGETSTLSGVGINRIWAWSSGDLELVAGPDHPDLSQPGIPNLPPRALLLENPRALYLGLCHDDETVPQSPDEALQLSGLPS
ncbi:MAG: hypothetical protein VX519_09135 [Myxococcota bacterium]|nr:hypothetical protein [Myxococcota bacterium]